MCLVFKYVSCNIVRMEKEKQMKTIRKCELCHRQLKGYGQSEVCSSCQEKQQDVLDRHFELVNISLTVKQAAMQLDRHPGHLRRVLEHPEKYHWSDYGITDAVKEGKDWRVYLDELEHKPALRKQLIDIRNGALNYMMLNVIFGLGPVLMPSDAQSLLECQITLLPRRKTPREREVQKKRIRQNLDQYVDKFSHIIAPIVEEKLSEMELLRAIASTGRRLHT